MRIRSDLVTLRRYGAVWEAEIVRDRLDAAGIQAFVQGSETGRVLSYVGAALGGVRVQVAARDVESARQILRRDEHQRATAGDWRCPRCDEPNDASFDFCWSCSMPRDEVPAEQEGDELWTARRPLAGQPNGPPENGNPYRPTEFGGAFGDVGARRGLRIAHIVNAMLVAATILVLLYWGWG